MCWCAYNRGAMQRQCACLAGRSPRGAAAQGCGNPPPPPPPWPPSWPGASSAWPAAQSGEGQRRTALSILHLDSCPQHTNDSHPSAHLSACLAAPPIPLMPPHTCGWSCSSSCRRPRLSACHRGRLTRRSAWARTASSSRDCACVCRGQERQRWYRRQGGTQYQRIRLIVRAQDPPFSPPNLLYPTHPPPPTPHTWNTLIMNTR